MNNKPKLLERLSTAPVGIMLALLAGLAFILNLLLEILGRHSLIQALTFLIGHPILFLYNTLIILLTLSLCLAAKKRLAALLLLTTVWLALGVTNCIVLAFRSSPLSAIDFLIVKAALGMFSIYLSAVQVVLIIFLIAAFIALMIFLFVKCPKCRVSYRKSIACIAVIGLAVSGATLLGSETKAFEGDSTDLADAYSSYGFAYCFTRSLLSQGVDKPEEYDPDAVNELLDSLELEPMPEFESVPDPDELPPSGSGSEPMTAPNIIFVQLESFFDVSYINWLECSEDPTPTFSSLKSNGVSGFLRMANVGGGTANSEFEVLTGMNLDHFGFGEYPYTTILKSRACESVAFNLKRLGYSTHAIHNHTATFYDRNIAYSYLGFDTFTPVEMMCGVSYNLLGWECDDIMTDEILSALDSTGETPDFVFGVTVQGHGKYPSEPLDVDEFELNDYLPAFADSGIITLSGIGDEAELAQYAYYVNQLRETDNFIRELIEALSERGESCVVVFYGDHMPALALTDDDISNGDMYQTEYAIWTNTELFGDDANSLDRDLEAYMLSAYVQSLCGISEGAITRLHQSELQTGEDRGEELRILEYAQLYDNSVEPAYTPTEMTFGTKPVTIFGWQMSGTSLYIYGSGFNEYSAVRLGGFSRASVLLDEHTLRVDNIYFYDGIPEVVQLSSDGTELCRAVISGK